MRDLIFLGSIALVASLAAACGGLTSLGEGAADATADTGATDAAGVDGSDDAANPVDAGTDAAVDAPTTDAARDASTDAGRDASTADAGPLACGPSTCAAGSVCVRTYTTGGACLLCGDGGVCAAGSHCGGQCCVTDTPSYAYACKPTPAACAAGLTCSGTCGSALCGTGPCPCESASGRAATCHCLAP